MDHLIEAKKLAEKLGGFEAADTPCRHCRSCSRDGSFSEGRSMKTILAMAICLSLFTIGCGPKARW